MTSVVYGCQKHKKKHKEHGDSVDKTPVQSVDKTPVHSVDKTPVLIEEVADEVNS